MRFALVALLGIGCGKQLNPDFCAAHDTDERCTLEMTGADARRADATIDVPVADRIYVAGASGDLYSVDVVSMTSTLIGVSDDPDAPGTPMTIDGLGFATASTLVGVTSEDYFVRIDPATAVVTSKVKITVSHDYLGMTVAPPGALGPDAAMLVAAQDDQHLYELATDGTVRDIGSFGGDLKVAGDISWVPSVGLFATVSGTGCAGTCVASVSPTTGHATLLAATGPGDLWATAAFGGALWAIGGSGDAYVVNRTTGDTTQQFATTIPGPGDAAP